MAKPEQGDAALSRGGMSSPPRGCVRVPMAAPSSAGDQRCGLRLQRPAEGTLLVHLSGSWRLRDRLPDAAEIQREIDGIVGLTSRPAMSRVLSEIGVVFCRGVDVELEFDEEQFAGSGAFLFASVLERFLGLYAALNSFSRLTVRTRQRKGVLKQWAPLAGEQRIL